MILNVLKYFQKITHFNFICNIDWMLSVKLAPSLTNVQNTEQNKAREQQPTFWRDWEIESTVYYLSLMVINLILVKSQTSP